MTDSKIILPPLEERMKNRAIKSGFCIPHVNSLEQLSHNLKHTAKPVKIKDLKPGMVTDLMEGYGYFNWIVVKVRPKIYMSDEEPKDGKVLTVIRRCIQGNCEILSRHSDHDEDRTMQVVEVNLDLLKEIMKADVDEFFAQINQTKI